jgi:hypothetical protein
MIALNDHYESIIRTNLIPMLIIKNIDVDDRPLTSRLI